MHKLYELKETLCKELEEYAKNDQLDMNSLEIIDKLAHSIKNIDKIIYAEEYSGNGGYSNYSNYGGGYSNARGYSNRQYSGEYSGARMGRSSGARRDSMGRYSGGMDMASELRRLMEEAPDEQSRAELGRMAQRYE